MMNLYGDKFDHYLLALLLLAVFGAVQPARAEVDEQALIEEVRQAEARVERAQTKLRNLQQKYNPKIEAYKRVGQDLTDLRKKTREAYDASSRAYAKIKRLPKSLTDRKSAVLAELSNLQLKKLKKVGDVWYSKEISQKKRELAEVRRQIADFEKNNNLAERRMHQARARADRLYDAATEARRLQKELALESQTAQPLLYEAEKALAKAREELERVKSRARWNLNDKSAALSLAEVTVKSGAEVFYQAEWHGDEEDTEDLLKLAQYLHEDLSRTISKRHEKVQELRAELLKARQKTQAANRRYVDYMGRFS